MSDISYDLDLTLIEGLRELLEDKFAELIETFKTDSARRIALIASAVPAQDLDVVSQEAHGLKGSCRNLGANSLAAICDQMEQDANAGDASQMEQLLTAIEQQFAAIAAVMDDLLEYPNSD
jgi:FOG: HPt domain